MSLESRHDAILRRAIMTLYILVTISSRGHLISQIFNSKDNQVKNTNCWITRGQLNRILQGMVPQPGTLLETMAKYYVSNLISKFLVLALVTKCSGLDLQDQYPNTMT